MSWLQKRRERLTLPPLDPQIVEAHEQAIQVKATAEKARAKFHRLGVVMADFHRRNGFAEKLSAAYEGKGLL